MPPGQVQRDKSENAPLPLCVSFRHVSWMTPMGAEDGLVEAHDPHYEMFGFPRINRRES